MPRFLPPEPDLDHLKNEAKALCRAYRRGDRSTCSVLRHLHRFAKADDAILSAGVNLTEVQFALARDYGFGSWQELRGVVTGMKPVENYASAARPGALILPDLPAGVQPANSFAAALSMALGYLGVDASYAQVMGDSGLAFLLQADDRIHPYGADVPNLDVGWWPLDPWGFWLRLDFLGRVFGVVLRLIRLPEGAELAAGYDCFFHASLAESLQAGRPAIAYICPQAQVVFGLDDGDPPLLVQRACSSKAELLRAERYPAWILTLGEPGRQMDRRQADAEALRFALAIGRDQADLTHLPGKSSGRISWDLWKAQLADANLCGPHYFHANVVWNLKLQRSAAVEYLRAMAGRQPAGVATILRQAADAYAVVLDCLQQADTDEKTLATEEGRMGLMTRIDQLMADETRALAHLESAHDAMA